MEAVFWIEKHLNDKTYADAWLKTLSSINKKYPITKLTYVISDNTEGFCVEKKDGSPLDFEKIKSDIEKFKRDMRRN